MNPVDLCAGSRGFRDPKGSGLNKGLGFQMEVRILPIGVAEAGAWRYSHIYELTSRHFPDLAEQARSISKSRARVKLVELYLTTRGYGAAAGCAQRFRLPWKEIAERAVSKLVAQGAVIKTTHPKHEGEWLALSSLVK